MGCTHSVPASSRSHTRPCRVPPLDLTGLTNHEERGCVHVARAKHGQSSNPSSMRGDTPTAACGATKGYAASPSGGTMDLAARLGLESTSMQRSSSMEPSANPSMRERWRTSALSPSFVSEFTRAPYPDSPKTPASCRDVPSFFEDSLGSNSSSGGSTHTWISETMWTAGPAPAQKQRRSSNPTIARFESQQRLRAMRLVPRTSRQRSQSQDDSPAAVRDVTGSPGHQADSQRAGRRADAIRLGETATPVVAGSTASGERLRPISNDSDDTNASSNVSEASSATDATHSTVDDNTDHSHRAGGRFDWGAPRLRHTFTEHDDDAGSGCWCATCDHHDGISDSAVAWCYPTSDPTSASN